MGPLLASGRDADVFAIDALRVLRRYRDGSEVTAEAAVMRSARGPVVIDWHNAAEGPARTGRRVVRAHPGRGRRGGRHPASLLDAFLHETGEQAAHGLTAAVERRRHDPNLTGPELDQLPAAAVLIRG